MKDVATAPLVRNAVPGLTDKLESSGVVTYHIKSLLIKITKCKVPEINTLKLVKCFNKTQDDDLPQIMAP